MPSFKKLAISFGLAATVLGAGGRYVYNMAYNYSEGARPGTVFKISKKGALCKTWEGQLDMHGYGRVEGQGNGMSSYLEFTVMNEALARKIEDAQVTGKSVNLEYRQVKWKWSCLQESEYVATGLQEVDANGRSIPYIMQVPNPVQAPKRTR